MTKQLVNFNTTITYQLKIKKQDHSAQYKLSLILSHFTIKFNTEIWGLKTFI